MRIVSLLPSSTEIVCLLGLEDQLVGVSHECDYPPAVAGLPKVTRFLIPLEAGSAEIDQLVRARARSRMPLYQLDLPTLLAVTPDLIVTQALCDVCAVDETAVLQAACTMLWRPRVLSLEPHSLESVFGAIQKVADAARVSERGALAVERLQNQVRAVSVRSAAAAVRPSVVFLEWLDPFFCGGHWNPELVDLAGGRECIGRAGERSRRIDFELLAQTDPDVIVIACCGYGVERTLVDLQKLRQRDEWNALRAVRTGRVVVMDGSAYFNRPGPRLVESLQLLAHALHPQLHPLPVEGDSGFVRGIFDMSSGRGLGGTAMPISMLS